MMCLCLQHCHVNDVSTHDGVSITQCNMQLQKRMSTFPSIVLHDDSMKMRDIIRLYELQQDESMMMRLSIQCRINIVMHLSS